MYKCIICGKKFKYDWRVSVKNKTPLFYCSSGCAHTRYHTDEIKKVIAKKLDKGKKKYCKICKKKINYRNKSGFCKNCKPKIDRMKNIVKYVTEHRKKRKEYLVNYKGGKCERCGYSKYIGALEFHHINPKEKDFALRSSATRSLEKDIIEVNKCLLLCSNCHKEIHEEERQKLKENK